MNRWNRVSCVIPLVAATFIAAACSEREEPRPAETASAPASAAPPAMAAAAGEVVGKVPVTPGAGTVVIFEPTKALSVPPPTDVSVMDQQNLTFIPHFLFVRTGQAAEFLNHDEELHNLNVKDSESRAQVFNVAIPPEVTYRHTFERDGIYDVSCDIHPGMSAQIFAVSTPYATVSDAQGSFTIPDVAPGSYKVKVFAGAKIIERTLEIGAGATDLDFTDE